jgi:tetratricopeptide (TPR) repeat protein
MNPRLVRVFISSTFRDFIQERDELVKKVFPELRRRCKERFVELLEVDLRWGITEEQAKGGETLRICLEEIDRCRPSAPVFFIGLLGERYGWIPPKDFYTKEVLEDPNLGWVKEHIEGKSVTELEILHGVLRNEAMREKAFFYFRNDGYQERHWQQIESHHRAIVPPVTKEDFTNAKSELGKTEDDRKQRELKQAIRDASLAWDPRNYEAPEDMGRMVLEDLWAAIDRVFPEGEVPEENERHRLEHDAFGQSRTKGYVQRDGLFEKLDTVLLGDGPSVLAVTGESGGGKSALLAAWLSQLGNRSPLRKFVHYIGGTPESSTARSIVLRLMNEMRAWGAAADPVPDDFGQAVEALPVWLAHAAQGQKGGVLIVLDALNQLESERDRTLWWLPKDLPAGVHLVVSTLPGECEEELKRRGWLANELSVPPLTDKERRQIISDYLGRFTKKLASSLVERLAGAPQASNPLFLRVVLDELRVRARHEELGPMLDKMLEARDPSELFVQVLKNLEEFDKERPNLVRESMGLLALARRGLSEDEVLQLLSSDPSPSSNPLPRHYWSPLYLALEDSFVSRNGQLSFFHDYLRQAVEKEYLDEEWERKQVNSRLGEVALAHETECFSPSLKHYGLAHGPWHLRRANDLQRLWSLLSDLRYRLAQSEACGSSLFALEGLTEGVNAYAEQAGSEIDSDVRLAWLAATRADVQENERLEAIPRAFEEFAAATICDESSISRLLGKLTVLSGADYYLASQIVILMVGLSGRDARLTRAPIEMVVAASEERVTSGTDVEILPSVAEVLAAHDIELVHRFASRSKSGSSLIAKCAAIRFSKGDFVSAVRLDPKLLPKVMTFLTGENRHEEALKIIGTMIDSWQEDTSASGQALLVCLQSLQALRAGRTGEYAEDLVERCRAWIPDVVDDDLRVRCWCLVGELMAGEKRSTGANDFDQAFAAARSRTASEQRLSSVIETCRALIRVGESERAQREFDIEIKSFASSAKPGTDACSFVIEESDGLAEIFGSCAAIAKVDLWMNRLVDSVYDPNQMNSNGYFTGLFSEAVSELLRKIYEHKDRAHRNWIPPIVDKFYSERPTTDFGEAGSIAAAGLASVAATIALAGETEKSLRFHELARREASDVYQRTSENEFLRCAEEAIRSGQIGEAFAYIETYEQLARAKRQNADWASVHLADALIDGGFLDQAASLIRKKGFSAEHSRPWSATASRLLGLFCEEGRFDDCSELLPLIRDVSANKAIEALARGAAAAAVDRQWELLEAILESSTSLGTFIPSFDAAWKCSGGGDSTARSALLAFFDRNYGRLRGGAEKISTLAQVSQTLSDIGRYGEAKTVLAEAYRSHCTRENLRNIREGKSNLAHLVHKIMASMGEMPVEKNDAVVGEWNDPDLHDQCLVHLAESLVQAKFESLAWPLLAQIRNQRIWLRAFKTFCSLLSNSSSEIKDRFVNGARPALRRMCEDEDEPVKGVRLRSPDEVTMVEGMSAAAASLAVMGEDQLSRELITTVREAIDPKSESFRASEFVPAAIQARCVDVALEVMDKAIVSAADLQHSVDREMRLTALIETIPLFPGQKERRKLLAQASKIARGIRRRQGESQNLADIVCAAARSGEFRLAKLLEGLVSKGISDQSWSERTRAFIASEMAIKGEASAAIELLVPLPNSHAHTDAWSNVAMKQATSGDHEDALDNYRATCSAIFARSARSVLTKDFAPVLRSLAALPDLDPFKGLIKELTSHQIVCEDLWEPVFLIFSRSCFNYAERSELMDRFVENSLRELDASETAADVVSPTGQSVLIKLSNVAIKHLDARSGWTERLREKTGAGASEGLHLGKVDFGGRLPWIRSFFAFCSANPAITKMQVTALVAAYVLKGNLSGMSAITRTLPQTDLWEALSEAVVTMNMNAAREAESLEAKDRYDEAFNVRMSALDLSSQILGCGEKSVVKFADSIPHWSDDDRKLAYYRQAVASSESLYGNSDAHFSRLANKLGIMLFEGGSYEEALPLFIASHDGYVRTVGSESDETLSSLLNCALARRKLGQLTRSIEDLRSVVDGRRRLLGDSDRRTLRALDEIAKAYMQKGSWEMAAEALKIGLDAERPPGDGEVPPQWRKLLAYEENRAQRLLRLSEALFANKKLPEAKSSVEESIELYSSLAANTRVSGDRRERCVTLGLRARNLLAQAFAGLGYFSNAVRVQEGVVETLKASKGETNRQTCKAQLDLSALMIRSGDYPTCERVLRDLIGRTSDEASDVHAMAFKGLAQCLLKQGLPKEAISLVRRQSEKSDFFLKALRPTRVRLECLAGDPEKARFLASEVMASDPDNASKIKSRWLADVDFSVIHAFLEKWEQ